MKEQSEGKIADYQPIRTKTADELKELDIDTLKGYTKKLSNRLDMTVSILKEKKLKLKESKKGGKK